MTTLEIILILLLLGTCITTSIATYFAIKFGVLILHVEDSIEESLDVLEERYSSIAEVLEIPLFSDSPQIRQVHNDLSRSRDAVLAIAHILVDDFKKLEDDENEES